MLQDAEVKAPRRVWRAVSGRLDAAAAWWKWAVPAFAFAALAAGVFFTWNGKDTRVPENIVAQVVAPAEEDAPVAQVTEPAAPSEETAALPAAEHIKSSGKTFSSPAASITTESDSAPASAEEQVSGSSEAASAVEPVSDNGQPSGIDAQDSSYSEEDAARWAEIENAAPKASGVRISGLYAQGGVGGNDSNLTYGGSGISQMAPGAGSPDAGISESSTSTYGIPFTIGIGTRVHLGDKFSLGTGLEYSLLTRTFTGTYSDSYTGSIYHAVQYAGVPVNAYYDILSTADGLLNLYAWGGGAAEICVSNNYRLMSSPGTAVKDKAGAMQFSVALGMGVEFPLGGNLSLYLDPAVRYYFHGNQPKSLRTDKPFMFNMDAGLRFNF
ncbi:MAG: hypothetical protein J5737_02740 [Bacteroidales bacterium]|nr:hypothetical protein [Bacteroidales bacterium]